MGRRKKSEGVGSRVEGLEMEPRSLFGRYWELCGKKFSREDLEFSFRCMESEMSPDGIQVEMLDMILEM